MRYNETARRGKSWNGFKQPAAYCSTSGKVVYDKKGAATAANTRYREEHKQLRIYPCHYCAGWHLTSRL